MRQETEMRRSGYEWIGLIPKNWSILRMKNIFENISEKNHPDAEVLSLYRELGILPKNSRDDNHNVTSEDTASYKYVRKGNLVINKMKAWQGSLAISDYEGIVSPAYYVCGFVDEELSKRYYHYLIRSKSYAQEYERLSTGMRVGQWDLGIDDFMRIPALVPPIEEQYRIAEFLDQTCLQIDELIEETKASIEEYKQWKAALIEETVTRGVSENQKFKDSSLSWIKEIPSNWMVSRLKTQFSFGKGLPITKDNLTETGVPVISYGQIHAKSNTGTAISEDLFRFVSETYLESNPDSIVKKGDFLVADTSEDLEGCGNAVYVDRDILLFAGYHTIILKSNEEKDNKYLAYLFKSASWRSQIRTQVTGVKLFSVSKKILNTVSLIIPPIEEQEKIVVFLDEKCGLIDSIIEEKQALINDLDLYKKSLINEVVTGKRKVV